ncbi:MAG: DUF1576 domain-containing protein, partial [Eubacteriales bacterium]|nr:DUF1576 domain-containing protein [Eubacteriales bacterium]
MAIHTRRTQGSYAHMAMFFSFLVIASFFFGSPAQIAAGMQRILFSPSNLLTDYMEIAGVGAALFNSGTIGLLSLLFLRITDVKMDGAAIASLVTMCGFALFGKNLFNSIPIMLGALLYARVQVIPFRDVVITSLFATSLGPLVSELSFGLGLPRTIGILAGYAAGVMVGFVVVPLSKACMNFHHGYNLYNIGFTAGLIGMFAAGILRMFDLQVETVLILSCGNDVTLSFLLLSLFMILLLSGLRQNKWSFHGYWRLMTYSGR